MEHTMTAAELVAAAKETPMVREFAVQDLIPLGSVTVIAAKKGRGKSILTMGMSHHVSLGRPWLGRATKRGQVLYIGDEDDQIELTGRYTRLLESTGDEASTDLDINDHWPTVAEGGLNAMRQWCAAADSPVMIVVDVLSKIDPEMLSKGYNRTAGAMEPWIKLAREENIAVVLVVHMYRDWKRGDWRDAIVGSSGFTAFAQTVIGIFGEPMVTERAVYYDGKFGNGILALDIDGRTMMCTIRDQEPAEDVAMVSAIRAMLSRLVQRNPGLKARVAARPVSGQHGPDAPVDGRCRRAGDAQPVLLRARRA
jgi:hypothetical protein